MRIALALLIAASAWLCGNASAHSFGFSYLHVQEIKQNYYQVIWTPSEALTNKRIPVALNFPNECEYNGSLLHCPSVHRVPLMLDGLPSHAEVVLVLQIGSEPVSNKVFAGKHITLDLTSTATSHWQTVYNYFVLGIEHIVFGFDHLLFVIGLVLLSGLSLKLVGTITAFTVAHSVTLSLNLLGIINIAIVPVEILIALSIVFVAREALSSKASLSRRMPWLVAFVFGLIHGVGFASALGTIGLPPFQEGLALVSFNIGVEIGQLCVIGICFIVVYLVSFAVKSFEEIPLRESVIFHPTKNALCFLLGVTASFWVIERTWWAFA